jgi:formylglycine-generating enzyme required for sulfatase activity
MTLTYKILTSLWETSNWSYDPNNKIIRGGSFFFDQAAEISYTVSFRSFNTTETSLFNLGFRCAKDGVK